MSMSASIGLVEAPRVKSSRSFTDQEKAETTLVAFGLSMKFRLREILNFRVSRVWGYGFKRFVWDGFALREELGRCRPPSYYCR